MDVRIKRAYEPPAASDGHRVLIDRLWPRGVKREGARLDEWAQELAPSDDLRRWFGHDPGRFAEFRRRYEAELAAEPARSALARLREMVERERVTLVFAAHDPELSNAAVLRDLLHGDE
jgi:uncharacterized protein YeaO (DUF488 family)